MGVSGGEWLSKQVRDTKYQEELQTDYMNAFLSEIMWELVWIFGWLGETQNEWIFYD